MIASIRNFALISSIVPALALTGCSEGMLDGPITIDFQNFPTSGQVQLVADPTESGEQNPESPTASLPDSGSGTDPLPEPDPLPQDATIRVSWDANPVEDNVQYYEVMYGEAENQVDYFYTQTMNEANFDLNTPGVVLQQSDLAHVNNSNVCFAVKAYNYVSESDPSQAVCAAI